MHAAALDADAYVPEAHASHVRSRVALPGRLVYVPGGQEVHAAQAVAPEVL